VFNAEILNNITGKCPEVDIEIENQLIKSLIDTGSQVSTISESFFNNLLKQRPILYDITRWMKVTGANDLSIPYIGYIEVDIKIMNTCIPKVGMLMIKDSDIQSILGSNFLNRVKDTVDSLSDSEKKKLLGCQISSILTLYNISVENHSETNDNDILSFVKIAGNSPVLIPANSMKVLTRQRNDRSEKYCAVVQAIQGTQGALNRNLLLVDSYSEVVNSRIPVRLVNVRHESIWLKPKTRVGILQNAKVLRESPIEESIDIDVSQSEIHVSINNIEVQLQDAVKSENTFTLKQGST
jgi:hypothetical protein